MGTLKLTGRKIIAIRFNIVSLIIFVAMTVRSLTAGDGVMLAGLSAAWLPFFAQIRNITCADESYTEKQEIFSNYLVYLFFVTIFMLYIKGLTMIAAQYVPGYVPSPIMRDLFLLTYVCDISFVSIMVPFTCSMNSMQRLTLAALLCNLEIGFMVFANKVLVLLEGSFVLHQHWGLYFVAAMIVFASLSLVGINTKKKKDDTAVQSE